MATHRSDVSDGAVASHRDDAAGPVAGEARLSKAARLVVPDAIGLNVLDAHRLVREQRLSVAISVWETKIGPWGLVLSQDPEPGSVVRPGTRILVVVAGRPHLTVPNVRDLPHGAAVDILRRLGLRPEVARRRVSRTVEADHVISTLPGPGSLIADGSRIVLEISRGRSEKAATVPAPDASNEAADPPG